jgi:glucosamine-6-phosphate deaminase
MGRSKFASTPQMDIHISNSAKALGDEAGLAAANLIRNAIKARGSCNMILATGTSQFEMLRRLTSEPIEWDKVVMFHLDEYIGLPMTHGASFRKYLKERFLAKVGPLKAANLIDGEADAVQECQRLGKLIIAHPIDVAMVGIGENGHLAFNDPPADFDTTEPYIIVSLDDACRRQQLGEGWFPTFDHVPKQAISMSINHILKSQQIICSVPDARKATAVKCAVEGPVSNTCPASALQGHKSCRLFLDRESSAGISK